ncbi:hypothetical protein V5O48_012881 [Marasmius crinis-equi]|uniref:NACHT-NTPase and P-loop NTPases N-terminal domain-containing protein n=1 Tax=Marasmius crinis-equi TaxID=585013 RepID=A0ABR3F1M1_9AGAR
MCFSVTHSKDSPTDNKEEEKSSTQPTDQSNNVLAAMSGVSVIVLQTLQDVARFAPIPYLSDISAVALGILEAVQTFKGNKEGFRKLGEDVCELVYAINATCENLVKNGKPLSKDLEANLAHLSSSIKRVQAFVAKQLRRHRISRFLTYKSDSTAIQEYRDNLRHCLDVFGLQSDITIRELVSRIAEQQEVDRARGGTGRETDPEPIQSPQTQGAGGSSFQTTFPGFNSGVFSGSISVNNVAGNQHHSSNEISSTVNNSYNNLNMSGKRSRRPKSPKYPSNPGDPNHSIGLDEYYR